MDEEENISGPTVGEVLAEIAGAPLTVFREWNWKAAAVSALVRAGIFFITTMKAGAGVALKATLAEAVFAAVVAGMMGSVTQRLRNARPEWLTGVVVSLVMPGVLQLLQYALHSALGTPHLMAGMVWTFLYAALAMLFNWYAMRRGALLTSGEGRPFWRDMVEMPLLVGMFLMAVPMALWNFVNAKNKNSSEDGDAPALDASE